MNTTGLFILTFLSALLFGLASTANIKAASTRAPEIEKAIFAGGCFWCMEKPFEELDGVYSVSSGYTSGTSPNPTYKDYGAGGHLEAIEIEYDKNKISYSELLEVFWRQIDPTDAGGQFMDRGKAYSTAIFYLDQEQKALAEKSKTDLEKKGVFREAIVTPIIPATAFYPAEDYHQDYYKKNPLRYKVYRLGSGRDRFLDKIWQNTAKAATTKDDLRQRLTPMQYRVTQKDGTEPAFNNEYWNNKKAGIYVDIVSGEALFSSLDKYDSRTGWPSFTKPLISKNIVKKNDWILFSKRIEVRSKGGDSHLGHIFNDGPPPDGLRYCINSAALDFIPLEKLSEKGYGEFLELFK